MVVGFRETAGYKVDGLRMSQLPPSRSRAGGHGERSAEAISLVRVRFARGRAWLGDDNTLAG